MAFRGPDSAKVVSNETGTIGAVRLAIMDEISGEQPMVSPDGRHVVALNGEIFNFRQLRTDLAAGGWAFKTDCDTEVILALMSVEGLSAVEKLRGIFSFLWLDRRSRELHAIRDHFGTKPLYVHEAGQRTAFASKISVLLSLCPHKLKINHQGLHDFFSFRCYPNGSTPFSGIRECPPGSITTLDSTGTVKINYWWRLSARWGEVEPVPENKRSLEDFVEELEFILDDIVRSETQSDREISGFLSSGIDSALVVESASRQGKLRTAFGFSLAGVDKRDEFPGALSVADNVGISLNRAGFSREDEDLFDVMLSEYDVPAVCSLQIRAISRAAAENFKVVLTGSGGDELFGGYDRHWKADPAVSLLKRNGLGPAQLSEHGEKLFYERQFIKPERRSHMYTADFKSQIDDAAPLTTVVDLLSSCPREDALSQTMYYDQSIWMPQMVNTNLDRMSMSQSIEARVPLMRREILEFALQLPSAYLCREGKGKLLLRRLLEKRVGTWAVERPKLGFTMPLMTWLHKIVERRAPEVLTSDRFIERKIVEPAFVDWLLNFNNRKVNGADTLMIWALFIVEKWFQKYID